jgi:hypothetical protein
LAVKPDGSSVGYRIQTDSAGTFQGTLPYDSDAPAVVVELMPHAFVALSVSGNLGAPEIGTRRRKPEQRTVVAVPEAAVNEQYRSKSREHQIRFAGERCNMKPVTKAACEEFPAQFDFRFRIAPANAGHHPAARGGVHDIRQLSVPLCRA